MPSTTGLPTEPELKKMSAKFAPVALTANVESLPDNERRALAKIVRAAQVMDPLYLRQVWGGNEGLLMRLAKTRPLWARPASACSCSIRARGPGLMTIASLFPVRPPSRRARPTTRRYHQGGSRSVAQDATGRRAREGGRLLQPDPARAGRKAALHLVQRGVPSRAAAGRR